MTADPARMPADPEDPSSAFDFIAPAARPEGGGEDQGGRLDGPHPFAVVVVKGVHTAVFFAELTSILWLVISGFLGRRDRTVALASGLVAVEAAVFVINDGVCPLTPLTVRLGADRGSVSDIYLPAAVARTIPIWSSALVALGIVLHLRAIGASGDLRRRATPAFEQRPFGPRRNGAGSPP